MGSPVNGSDETGARLNSERHWFWVWQTVNHTYMATSNNRANTTVEEHFPSDFQERVLVSDSLATQLKTPTKHHQCCLAHLQRDLKYLNELYRDNHWGNRFLKRLDKLLYGPPDKRLNELVIFYNQMKRNREQIFTFLDFKEVPSDNNA